AFFEEGEWDSGGDDAGAAVAPPAGRGVLGAMTARLRNLAPRRLLGPRAAEPTARSLPAGNRIEPSFDSPEPDNPPARRRLSMRGIALPATDPSFDAPAGSSPGAVEEEDAVAG